MTLIDQELTLVDVITTGNHEYYSEQAYNQTKQPHMSTIVSICSVIFQYPHCEYCLFRPYNG